MKDISPVKITFACFVFLASLFLSADIVMSLYCLFLAGIVMYFLRGYKELWSSIILLKIAGVIVFSSLIYPLIEAQLAIVAGFLGILWVFKKGQDGRFSFGAALFFLILCPVFLSLRQDKIAEGSAIFAFYFLTAGTIQEIINLIVNPQKEDEVQQGFEKMIVN